MILYLSRVRRISSDTPFLMSTLSLLLPTSFKVKPAVGFSPGAGYRSRRLLASRVCRYAPFCQPVSYLHQSSHRASLHKKSEGMPASNEIKIVRRVNDPGTATEARVTPPMSLPLRVTII
ncbi:hypothetical protein AVEN_261411-1 [Araneus ventricosus]|uniref:Uncharacterized protein n=1 Tax=Araneus ventricosus TaxID=182803 RepID=A0A4Y2VTS5_ARAVE|nr:hypothetical protein AVEN_261411-1 [Araneus ventricosus]